MPAPNTPNDLASALAARWESQFAKLVAFQQRHGHCRVPVIRQEDRVLSNWVNSQRSAWRNGVLKPDRRQRLEQIGGRCDILSTPGAGTEIKFFISVPAGLRHHH